MEYIYLLWTVIGFVFGVVVCRLLIFSSKPSGIFYIDESNIEDVKLKLEMSDDIDILAKKKYIKLRVLHTARIFNS